MTDANAGIAGVFGINGLHSLGDSLVQRRSRLVLGGDAAQVLHRRIAAKTRLLDGELYAKNLNGEPNPEPQTYNSLQSTASPCSSVPHG